MTLTAAWAVLRRLPWRIIGPLAVVLALGVCVRAHVRANAKAEAYATLARMTNKYAQQVEQRRMSEKRVMEDSIAKLSYTVYVNQAAAKSRAHTAAKLVDSLQTQLADTAQQQQLANIKATYESALVKMQVANNALADALALRTKELQDAENSLQAAALAREQDQLALAAKHSGSSTGWKIATAVSTLAALGLGIAHAVP